MAPLPKVAIVGSGIAGLAAAHGLHAKADITLFEAGRYFGGHTHTVDVCLPTPEGDVTHGVDTGFLVFNERTYPQLIRLFGELGVATVPSDMSFSVQVPDLGLEWSGSDLNTVFAQRRNLVRPAFLGMLRDALGEGTQRLLKTSLPVDLSHVGEAELERRVREELAAV